MAITPLPPPQAKTTIVGIGNKSKRPISIRFNESANVAYANTKWTAEDCRALWYTKFDYKNIKEAAHGVAKQLYKRERCCNESVILLDLFDACRHNQTLSEDDQAALTDFVRHSNTRTGLEKLYMRELRHDKRQRRVHLMDMATTSTRSEVLATASASLSRVSCLFAHHMALALHHSLH